MKNEPAIFKGGECGQLIRDFDWSKTSLGAISDWPEGLLANVNTMLNSPLAYVFLCGEEGNLIYNDAYARFAQDKHPEILGVKVVDSFPEIADYNLDIMKRVRAGETIVYKDQLLQLRRSAHREETEDVYIDLTYSPIFDDAGNVSAVTVIVIETTDKYALGESRKETAKVSAERDLLVKVNSVKDDFISVASHELRTPATAVKQYLGMVLQGYAGELTEVQNDYLYKANLSNERQLKTIDDLLRVARVDSSKFTIEKQLTDIGAMLENVVNYHKPRFENEDQEILLVLPKKKIETMIDSENVSIAVDNLIDNARKYSPEGSKTIVSLTAGDEVEISVTDTGVGVDKNDMKKLFTKFQRIDNDRSVEVGGTGLGLYWSQQVVQLHDGKIVAKQNKPHGMVFSIRLPQS